MYCYSLFWRHCMKRHFGTVVISWTKRPWFYSCTLCRRLAAGTWGSHREWTLSSSYRDSLPDCVSRQCLPNDSPKSQTIQSISLLSLYTCCDLHFFTNYITTYRDFFTVLWLIINVIQEQPRWILAYSFLQKTTGQQCADDTTIAHSKPVLYYLTSDD